MIARKKEAPGKESSGVDVIPIASGKVMRKRRRGGRGSLWAIALMLAASGVLRFGGETGRAIAGEFVVGVGEDGATTDATCDSNDDIAALLALIDEREAKVSAREDALADRMQALAVAEDQIAKNMAALKEAETSLEGTMALASTAAEDDLVRLTSVYENMKPKDAAALFAAMDPQFAAGFLGRMRSDAAASIMAGLDPEAAYTISVLLAGRNALVPTE